MKRDRAEALTMGLEDVELKDDDYSEFKEAIEQDIAQDDRIGKEDVNAE